LIFPEELLMRARLSRFVFIAAVAMAGMVVGRISKSAELGAADMALRLAQEMAAAASRRDVKSLEKLIPQTDRVAYVSNGHPITGRQYAETLGQYYASLKSIDFKWDRWEVFPIADRAAVFTGWASVKTVDQKGDSEAGRALFTMVFADDGSGWKRVIAQK
jgi:SnoaL-like protein